MTCGCTIKYGLLSNTTLPLMVFVRVEGQRASYGGPFFLMQRQGWMPKLIAKYLIRKGHVCCQTRISKEWSPICLKETNNYAR
jgi:hypothetical protein